MGLQRFLPLLLAFAVAYSKVDVDFFVMPKCPDAKECEEVFLPLLQHSGIPDLNINVHMIGDTNATTSKFICRHGNSECTGGIAQLCAQKYYPGERMLWADLIACMNNDQTSIPSNIKHCSEQLHLDYKQLYTCTMGEEGTELMRKSIAYTHSKGVLLSCTIHVAGAPYCTIDDSTWKECRSLNPRHLLKEICQYDGMAHHAKCGGFVEAPADPKALITDAIEPAAVPANLGGSVKHHPRAMVGN